METAKYTDIKYILVAMALAMVVFFSVDKLGLIGDSYGSRSLALHAIFFAFGWIGYVCIPDKLKE